MCNTIGPIAAAVVWFGLLATCQGQSGTRSQSSQQSISNGSATRSENPPQGSGPSARAMSESKQSGSSSRMMAEPVPPER